MYYKITLNSPVTTMAEELQLNQSEARQLAFDMLQANNKQGEVVIERRNSPYFGEYKHYMTCSFSDTVR